ncbi:putative nuclease HARBI1 [Microcaecilia unicolor]|uniref:Putative nuclease HARBI1 n=1 Tax=Microcaecilia unicolor TaxID=1415580 RepID=A0A6P7Z381_9AMPH|nr:putative nuclease HARBI1 [Microcaecilia unicolor]
MVLAGGYANVLMLVTPACGVAGEGGENRERRGVQGNQAEERRREEGQVRRPRSRQLRQRMYRPRAALEGMPEKTVVHNYRLCTRAILALYEEIKCDIDPATARGHAIPGLSKLLGTLHFLGNGSFQNAIGMACGMDQSSFSRHFNQVLQALKKRVRNYIRFPEEQAQWQELKSEFFNVAGVPDVMGAIDCTHVALAPPSDREMAFRNQKNYYSLNIQVVCDARMKILNVVAKFPGSFHDSYILSNSALGRNFTEGKYGEGWLLGDAAYGCKPWLLTPLSAPHTPAERRYNEVHATTRSVIDRTFRVLKSRFRCLDRSRGSLQYAPEKVADIVLVCCMLHNLALSHEMLSEVAPDLPREPLICSTATEPDAESGIKLRQKVIEDNFS